MSDVQLSESQKAGIKKAVYWYKHELAGKQIFRVFGFAGSGKTTLIEALVKELGLSKVLYAAFTGKAALVMTRHGNPASTLHSILYRVREKDREAYRAAKKLYDAASDGPERHAFLLSMKLEKTKLMQPIFELDFEESPLLNADLLVLDEVSMVGEELARDALAFNIPILVLGDPGQLPPIDGHGYFTQAKPDVMLREIHRQAKDSPIIQLATMAREMKPISPGKYGEKVVKTLRCKAPASALLRADQVICSRNATRRKLNWAMKLEAGFPELYPTAKGEKLICLRNKAELGLLNGLFVTMQKVVEGTNMALDCNMTTEDGFEIEAETPVYKGYFEDYLDHDPDRRANDHFIIRDYNLVELDWGWAITCHKSQGSQWENVVVYNEGFGRSREAHAQWLYTAITRAVSGLAILG